MNNKILVISGTNRPNSNTLAIASYYHQQLLKNEHASKLLDLNKVDSDVYNHNMYATPHASIEQLVVDYLDWANKFVFVVPEYNGGYPGILKAFIDAVPPSKFHFKKAALIGLSSGHLGCVRGMDSLTNVLNYLKVSVLFNKPKLSAIESLLDVNKHIVKPNVIEGLERHQEQLIEF